MMNEELYLKSRMGNENPFRVPEGYFDNFAAEMMRNLPEQPQQSKFVRLRPFMYAAACLVVAILTATIYFFPHDNVEQNIAAVTPTLTSRMSPTMSWPTISTSMPAWQVSINL